MLGAWYMLTLLRRVFFGPLQEPHHEGHGRVADLNGRELAALVPIALACLVLGVYSSRCSTLPVPTCAWSPTSPAPPTTAPRSSRRTKRLRAAPTVAGSIGSTRVAGSPATSPLR